MRTLWDWLRGDLSQGGRIWTAISPAIVLLAILLGGLLAYALRNARRGTFHDEEMDHRGLGGLTTARARHFFAWLMRPLWQGLARAGIPPNAITTFSVCLSFGAGVAFAAGRFALGGWLYLAAGGLDFLDGRVARATNRASPAGAALDSVLDRYCEASVLIGLAWYYRDGWVLFACLLALTGSLLVSYVRARGESLGVKMGDVGMMQRAERIIALGVTTAISPVLEAVLIPTDPHPPHRLAIVGIVLVALTSHATSLQRLAHLMGELGSKIQRQLRPFSRSVVVSVVATAADMVTVWLLVTHDHVGHFSPGLATVAGCVVGGLIAFTAARSWAFDATDGVRSRQATRFLFVSGSSALLNAGGVTLVLLLPGVDYRVAWGVTRLVVFVTWNYPLLRDFVFAPKESEPSVTSRA